MEDRDLVNACVELARRVKAKGQTTKPEGMFSFCGFILPSGEIVADGHGHEKIESVSGSALPVICRVLLLAASNGVPEFLPR